MITIRRDRSPLLVGGAAALWNVVIHESGRYTLGETVLYHSHFLREIAVDLSMALFILAAASGAGLPRAASADETGVD